MESTPVMAGSIIVFWGVEPDTSSLDMGCKPTGVGVRGRISSRM